MSANAFAFAFPSLYDGVSRIGGRFVISYEVRYSKRKTIAIQVTAEGTVLVRAPKGYPKGRIQGFVESHGDWIAKKLAEVKRMSHLWEEITPEEEQQYRRQAKEVLTEKVAFYAEKMGVTYGRITIRGQKTRWGSCSREGNLNFNWKLMLFPEEIQDYVVVHELAHRKEMNHSKNFYRAVEEILPDYKARVRWLREHA